MVKMEFKILIILFLAMSVYTMELPVCYDYWTGEVGFACTMEGPWCYERTMRCDGIPHCPGAMDELGCECAQEDTFTCVISGECLNNKYRCNSVLDCADGSDEHNCDYSSEPLTEGCQTEDGLPGFFCPGDDYCWMSDFRCNGSPECTWGADETGCECGPNKFVCASDGVCLSQQLRCNTIKDCMDGSDELDCNYAVYTGGVAESLAECVVNDTGAAGFMCHGSQEWQCMDSIVRCDGYTQCSDTAEDEIGCECKSSDSFLCNNGLCLNKRFHCNSINDCGDGSDEEGCEYHGVSETEECTDFGGYLGFNCTSSGYCASSMWRCDGEPDCPAWQDEIGCGKDRPERFLCEAGGISLDIKLRCNQVADCPDGSDELGCEFSNAISTTKECQTWSGNRGFKCTDFFHCWSSKHRCDGIPDCDGGEDEIACVCGPDKFLCDNGVCLDKNLRCNTLIDCDDGTDEVDCNSVSSECDCVEEEGEKMEQEDEEEEKDDKEEEDEEEEDEEEEDEEEEDEDEEEPLCVH